MSFPEVHCYFSIRKIFNTFPIRGGDRGRRLPIFISKGEITMFHLTTIHRIIALGLSVLIIGITSIPALAQEKTNPRIIFKDTAPVDTTKISVPAATVDSTGAAVIFKKEPARDDIITLISSDQFRFHEKVSDVGDGGELLKKAMGNNKRAIDMVDAAYSSRSLGTLLMILGGITIIIGIVTIPTTKVDLGSTSDGSYQVSYFWLPLVTLGTLIGGFGWIKHSGLSKNLREAVQTYNDDLLAGTASPNH